MFTDISNPYVYSNLSLAFRLPSHFTITPQAQYGYNAKELISARTTIEKPLFKRAYLNLSYEYNFLINRHNIAIGFRYDLSFAQTGFSIRNTNDQTTMVESARGSLLYDRKSRYLGTTNRTNVGKGGIILLPFLDINGNGKRDKGEPNVDGLKFRFNGGTIIRNDKDTTIRIMDLVPYTSYFLELDKNSFDNIAWQMHNLSMKVNIDANQFKNIEIPVAVMSEGSGTVYNELKGQGRILVQFYRNESEIVSRTMSESDGYYSYLGLKPGKYTARIDPEQLKKLKMVSVPEKRVLNIPPSRDGTIIDGLDFKIGLINKEPAADTAKIGTEVKPATNATPVNSSAKEAAPAIAAPPAKIAVQAETPAAQTGVPAKVAAPATALPAPPSKVVAPVPAPSTAPVKEAKPSAATAKVAVPAAILAQTPANDASAKYPVLKNRKGSIIQVGAFAKETNALKTREILLRITDNPVDIMWEDGLYKVQISGFQGRKQALEFKPKLATEGFPEAFLVRTDR